MNLRIGHKVFLATICVTGLVVAFMALAQRYTFERGLLNYAQRVELDRLQNLADELVDQYLQNGSWEFIAGEDQWPVELVRIGRGAPRLRSEDGVIPGAGDGKPFDRIPYEGSDKGGVTFRPMPPIWGRVSLLDENLDWVAGASLDDNGHRRELSSGGATMGYLALAPLETLSDELDLEFAQQQLRELFWVAILALIGAAVAAALLARSLGSPIRALARGTHALAGGNYDARLDQSRKDELGRLAEDFNHLAAILQQTRLARQQWVADISHELRTPIAVLQAELESLEDGFRPLDITAVGSLSSEVQRLRLLVDDLHQLTRSDSGELTFDRDPVDINSLLEHTVDRFSERLSASGLSIKLALNEVSPIIGDVDRLRQLFANLFENSLRYTDTDGTVRVSSAESSGEIRITIEDTAPGVPDEALPQLFDRLYRVDPSRSRDTGASGLGLAICESIVAAHGGTIRAEQSVLGGLAVHVDLSTHRAAE